MSNTSNTSVDSGVPSGETKPKCSGRKTMISIKWLACIFALVIVGLVTQRTLTSSHKNISYQPSASPRFAKVGNCQENKVGKIVRSLIPGDERNKISEHRKHIQAQLSNIHSMFPETVYPALEQLLQSENVASNRSDDLFAAVHKAKITLSIDAERTMSEIKKIARSIEETIQSPSDPKEWWWQRPATTARKESFAENQIEYMLSLYRIHENTIKRTIRPIPQIGHAADKARVNLNMSADSAIGKIQYQQPIQTNDLNEVLLDITIKDAFLQKYQSRIQHLGKMRFSQISQYEAESDGRQNLKKSYETSLEVLRKLEKDCRDLGIQRNHLQEGIARCTDSWLALWYRMEMECCFPSLLRLEGPLMGNQYLLD